MDPMIVSKSEKERPVAPGPPLNNVSPENSTHTVLQGNTLGLDSAHAADPARYAIGINLVDACVHGWDIAIATGGTGGVYYPMGGGIAAVNSTATTLTGATGCTP